MGQRFALRLSNWRFIVWRWPGWVQAVLATLTLVETLIPAVVPRRYQDYAQPQHYFRDLPAVPVWGWVIVAAICVVLILLEDAHHALEQVRRDAQRGFTADSPPDRRDGVVVTAKDDTRRAWIHIENNAEPRPFEVEIEFADATLSDHPYTAPWREGNIRSQVIARGGQGTIKLAEIKRPFFKEKSLPTIVRFYTTASSRGYFDRRISLGTVIGCRVRILRGQADAVDAGTFELHVLEQDRLRFTQRGTGGQVALSLKVRIADLVATRFSAFPLTESERNSLRETLFVAGGDPETLFTYPIEGTGAGRVLRFTPWNAFSVGADHQEPTLRRIAEEHASVVRRIRSWPEWQTIR